MPDRCEKCGHQMDTKRFELAFEIDYKDYEKIVAQIPDKYKHNIDEYLGTLLGKYIWGYLRELLSAEPNKEKFRTVELHDPFICKRAANLREMQ